MALRKVWAGAGLAGLLVVVWAGIAAAHVTVQPASVAQGSYSVIAFRVPNEKDVPTVGLKVKFPDDHPIPAARVKPVTGWTAKVTSKQLATPVKVGDRDVTEVVDTIEWTGGQIADGEFQEFEVSLAPAPSDATSITFPSIQTYGDGSEVAWIESGEDSEHPAPTLTLTPAATDAHGGDAHGGTGGTGGAGGAGTTVAGAANEVAATTTSADGHDTSSGSSAIAWVGVGLGAAALVLALVAVVRSGARPSAG